MPFITLIRSLIKKDPNEKTPSASGFKEIDTNAEDFGSDMTQGPRMSLQNQQIRKPVANFAQGSRGPRF